MDSAHNTAREGYRLIVTRSNVSEILLRSRGTALSLPSVEISRGRRIAQQLSAELYAQYGWRGYCLLVPGLAAGLPQCAVMEVLELGEIASTGTCWKALDAATCSSIESAEDRNATQKSIEELDAYRRKPNQEPFASPGWLAELFTWSEQQLAPLGLRLTSAFTQLNASPTFSLIRLEINDSAVWFKATGEPNRHELPITVSVARLSPGYVPEVLGVHAAWNGWLMREVPGRTLDDVPGLASWLQTAEDLAQLQIGSIGRETELLEASCRDLRLPRLIGEVDPWIDRMRGLMAAQEKQIPARLTDPELTLLGESLKEACSRLSETGLADTLGHLDFNPGNIVVSRERCVFLDWAEACVTNPLITFEYLREHFRRHSTDDRAAMESLVAAYVRPWESFFSPDALKQAMAISSLVAVFVYAIAGNTWRSSEEPLKPSVAAYSRSLARRMYREAIHRIERREQCLA